MKQIKFTIPGEPKGKGRPRVVNRGGFSKAYTPKDTVAYENLVRLEYGYQVKDFKFPDGAQLDMRIQAFYGIPKSASKKKRGLMLEGMSPMKVTLLSFEQLLNELDSFAVKIVAAKHLLQQMKHSV